MTMFSRNEFKNLMERPKSLCVSIFQPTHRPAAHTEQDRIRFKNLLGRAEEELIHAGMRTSVARELLAPGQALLDDSLFWQHQGEALKYDKPEKQLQWHTRAAQRGAERDAMFHGHGVGVDDAKDRILRYFRVIDAGLRDFLGNERVPLVLAGVEYYFPIYRQANTYPHLTNDGVPGSPEGRRAEELHRHAWDVVQPLFQRARQETLGRYRQLAETDRAFTDLAKILPATRQGRVECLFVDPRAEQWGTFASDSSMVYLHEQQEPGDDDLLDLALVHTLSSGGTVFPTDRDGVPVAAMFRY